MFVDIHHHLIWGLDDGASTFRETKQMLLVAQREGVSRIIATPHALPGRKPFPLSDFNKRLQMTQQWCVQKGLPIELHAGSEIMYTDDTTRLLREHKIPTLAGTRYVLVEFLPEDSFDRLRSAARVLGGAGYLPIFAHVERYRCLRHIDHVRELHEEYQVILQMNANTLLSKQGFLMSRWMNKVIEAGWIQIIATDAHNTGGRKCCLRDAYQTLKQEYGEQVAQRLCVENPKNILDGSEKCECVVQT